MYSNHGPRLKISRIVFATSAAPILAVGTEEKSEIIKLLDARHVVKYCFQMTSDGVSCIGCLGAIGTRGLCVLDEVLDGSEGSSMPWLLICVRRSGTARRWLKGCTMFPKWWR
jgi:hypothetical protein